MDRHRSVVTACIGVALETRNLVPASRAGGSRSAVLIAHVVFVLATSRLLLLQAARDIFVREEGVMATWTIRS